MTGCRGVDIWPVARMTNLTSLRIELDAEHFEDLFLGLAALRTLKIKFDGSALPRPLRGSFPPSRNISIRSVRWSISRRAP